MHVGYTLYMKDLPQDCIDDCSHPGPCDDDITFWVNRLNFTVNRQNAIECLQGYGAWPKEGLNELSDDDLAEKVLWLACCDFREYQNGGDSAGSDVFALE